MYRHPVLADTQRPSERRNTSNVALAGDHAQERTETWRAVLGQVYSFSVGAFAVTLLVLSPPHMDFHLGTVIPVIIVAAFLVAMERPTRTAATTVAPLTAIMAAAAVVFGGWMVFLACVANVALRWRLSATDRVSIFVHGTIGQIGSVILSSYVVLTVWSEIERLSHFVPPYLSSLVSLCTIVGLGLTWQTTANVFAAVHHLIAGKNVGLQQLFRTGIVASIYAYLLVGMYKFGGIIATTIFYVVVAQIKVVQDVLGITIQLHKLDRAQDQAQGMIRDLVRLTDSDHVEFSSEVKNISLMMGRRLGMAKKDVDLLGLAAELHQIGKAHLPARIRFNAGMNAKEENQRKTYSRWGGLMIRAADAVMPSRIADWIEFQGEHYDGTGYPRGLSAEDIPLPSRIIAVARDYIRLLTGYDGVQALDKEKALSLLREGSGTLYDPRVVSLLYELVS